MKPARPVDATLYVACDDLAAGLIARVRRWPEPAVVLIGERLCATALDLLVAVSTALGFPDERRASLAAADVALTRLRVLARLGERPPALFDEGARVWLVEALAAIGCMIGGWRRRLDGRPAGRRKGAVSAE